MSATRSAIRIAMRSALRYAAAAGCLVALACTGGRPLDPEAFPAGPGGMVGNGPPLTDGDFAGGDDLLPAPRETTPPDDTRPPDCGPECEAYCDAAGLANPVNRGLCRSLWGVGLAGRPIEREEACRRLFIDLVGVVPTADEMDATCQGSWGAAAKKLMADRRFVDLQRRRWADELLYSSEVVSLQAIYDMDRLVTKLAEGRVAYDQFAAVASAHPVLTRRHADARDTAEALFRHFLGRPPFENERADMARLYNVWHRGYYDHPLLSMRLPDSFIRFRCVGEDGTPHPERRGECASVLWGYHELILEPDLRAANDPSARALTTWSGLLTAEEWGRLQIPGRILSRDVAFWEHAVARVLEQYLGYDLAQEVPEVRDALVRWLIEHDGDIRSVHFAVVTSAAYLQSHALDEEEESTPRYRWTWGPLKQVDAETWLDSMAKNAGLALGSCDPRITTPEALLRSGSLSAYRLLTDSRWTFDEDGDLDTTYAGLARTLGGCPENVVGGRFRVVSILTTASQLEFVNGLCNPRLDPDTRAAPVERLLPPAVGPQRAVDADLAAQIATHQFRALLGHHPADDELDEIRAAGEECNRQLCSAEKFARPLCFALLSSAELLFY